MPLRLQDAVPALFGRGRLIWSGQRFQERHELRPFFSGEHEELLGGARRLAAVERNCFFQRCSATIVQVRS